MPEEVLSPVTGRVVKVNVKPGDEIGESSSLLVIEAMKMEIDIYPEGSGLVKEVKVKEGDTVSVGQILVTID